ncbi:hypothetical protein QL285_096523 [Trifolium repens]|nr:hypothetical protein QL285_096523 [Trifolium repens]
MDSASAKPIYERTFRQFVRILVDIDLLQPLRHKLLVERKGFAFFVDLEYEHIPAFCDGCKVIGHNFENCKRWNKDESMRNENNHFVKQSAHVEPKQIYVPTKDGRNIQSKPNEAANVEKEIINVEATNSKSPQVNLDGGNINDSRSSSKTSQNLQADKRQLEETVLCPVSPRSLLREQDKQLEKALNDDEDVGEEFEDNNVNTVLIVESSSQSFVNDTQPVAEPSQCENAGHSTQVVRVSQPVDNITNMIVAVPTPTRVAQDMEFLKDSWANMADAEEELQKKLEDTRQMEALIDDGFQIQLSKGQNRVQKKLKQSSKDSYATRSKGVSPRPFK